MASAARLLALTAVLTAAGCAAPEGLEATLDGPALPMSSAQAWHELRFVAHARTSAPLLGAEVRVHATVAGPASDDTAGTTIDPGQIRIMLARGALTDDHGRGESVLPLDDGAEVRVPRIAFDGCTGACSEPFAVVLSAEGIPGGVRVDVPLRLEATLLYDGEVPDGDAVSLELVPPDA